MAGSYNKLVADFAAAGLIAQGLLAPRRCGWTSHTVSTAVTTTVRVVGGVHYHTANAGTEAHMAFAAGTADLNILVLFVAYYADCGHTVDIYHPYFTTRQFHLGVILFFSYQLGAATGSPH